MAEGLLDHETDTTLHGAAIRPEGAHGASSAATAMLTPRPSQFLSRLSELVRDVAKTEIAPRFQRLAEQDVYSKATREDPTDIVTAADRAAEAAFTARLPELVPGSIVVGEEAVADNAALLDHLEGSAPVWLVDPLDGTRQFAAGTGPFAPMVALVEGGALLAAVIYFPLSEELFAAERGSGAFRNDLPLRADPRARAALRGTLYTRFMPDDATMQLSHRSQGHDAIAGVACAAHEYTQIALGEKDYVLYHRLFPWDHAPGALIVREAGGTVRHPDGREYGVLDRRELTLIAPTAETWERARLELFG
jgi:fructose-1,6-bisphosphatase/inositol monophosphatase family enzyme